MLEQLQTNLNKIDEGVFNPSAHYFRYPPTGANGLRKRYAGDGTTLRPRDYVEVDETDQPASRDERTIDEYRFFNIGEKGRDDELVPTLCRLERRRWDDDDGWWNYAVVVGNCKNKYVRRERRQSSWHVKMVGCCSCWDYCRVVIFVNMNIHYL